MPFTPFHFGPGLLFKSLGIRHFSFTAFVASQVIIDLETLYFLVRNEWPVHRSLHTFVGGFLAGAVVGLLVAFLGHRASAPVSARLRNAARAEVALLPALIGGVVGGLSHSLLDGLMHSDIRPLRPFAPDNPLQHMIDVGVLHVICTAAGVLALLILIARRVYATRRLTSA